MTIIVLLILAGISIQMLTGDNGILTRAGEAKERTEKANIIEQAKMDILGQIAENKGENITESQFKEILEKYFIKESIPKDLPEDLSSLELTTLNEKYKIIASDIYSGELKRLVAGLYDANDKLIFNWQELINRNYISVVDNYIVNRDTNNLEGKLIIDDSIVGLKQNALAQCEKLTNIKFPNSLKSIEDGGICVCTNLEELVLPDSINTMSNGVISSLKNLKKVNLGNGNGIVEYFSNNTGIFYQCDKLENVILGNKITIIPNGAFQGCSKLSDILIPNSVKKVGAGAFTGCDSLTNVKISEGVERIEDKAFAGCSSLTEIEIPESVKQAAINGIFLGCTSLKRAKIGSGVEVVEGHGSGFESIEEIYIGGSATGFTGIESLKSVTIMGEFIASEAFKNCTNLSQVCFGQNVKNIYPSSFFNCVNLQHVFFEGVDDRYSNRNVNGLPYHGISGELSIYNNSFEGCTKIHSIGFPYNYDLVIYPNAFKGCIWLGQLYFGNPNISIKENAFNNCSYLEEIHILYDVWNDKNYVKIEENGNESLFNKQVYSYDGNESSLDGAYRRRSR